MASFGTGTLAALVLAAACAWPGGALAESEAVGAIAAGPSDAAVLEHLGTLLEAPLVRRTLDHPDDLAQILAQGATWPERHLVVIDSERGVLHAVDTRDGTIVTRLLPDPAVRASPYAVAFVAAELLGLSVQLTEGPRAQATAPAPAPAPTPKAGAEPSGFAVGVGAELASQPASGAEMLRPVVEGLLRVAAVDEATWFFAGVRAAAFGSASAGSGEDQVELTRHHVGLRLGVGRSLGQLALLGALAAGLELGSTELASDGGQANHTPLGWLGLGLQARYRVSRPLSLFAGADALWTPVATRYRVDGAEVVPPARALVSASLGLAWDELP